MLTSDTEYKRTLGTIRNTEKMVEDQIAKFRAEGVSEAAIEMCVGFTRGLLRDMHKEATEYKSLKEGHIPTFSVDEPGISLVRLRIASGKSQKDLADLLGVSAAQVSRDERREYYNVSWHRVVEIVRLLGYHVEVKVSTNARKFERDRK